MTAIHPLLPVKTIVVLSTAILAASCVPDPGRSERANVDYLRIVAAEDARPTEGPLLRTLIDGTGHELAFIRHAAVRGLGRLERPELVGDIEPLLTDPSPLVRESAANAVAQAFHTSEDAHAAAEILLSRIALEEHPAVRGTLARSLGRLAVDTATRRHIADILVEISRSEDGDAPQATLLGVALGLESLIRRHPTDGVSSRVATRLHELALYPTRLRGDRTPPRIRGLALAALGISRRITVPRMLTALTDPEPQPGATVARFIDAAPPGQQAEILRRVIGRPSLHTVLEGFLRLQREPPTFLNCRYLEAGTRSVITEGPRAPIPVGVLATAAYDRPCPGLETQRALLDSVAGALDSDVTPWQAASRGLVSLAAIDPEGARRRLPRHAGHENAFVRTYAAEAATLIQDSETLRRLADDPHPNVRTAALPGLFSVEGHGIDPLLVEALDSDDPQLLLTVAGLLEGTPERDGVAEAALAAFIRISAARRETWRDPRRALLRLLATGGRPDQAEALEPYLEDYDPVVAEDVAALLTAWTGAPREADPRPLPRAELPTAAELRAMDGAIVRLHMEGGGLVDIELDPYLAATNAYRFFRLVGEGYFDGLTFHRWAPNFVLQGGSPGANEYQGAGAFSRDEVGLRGHWRGTVGISTRGHDTGDAQIFINLLDNVRLDHTYTIIGSVVDGMDTVDLAMDGIVIERAEVVYP